MIRKSLGQCIRVVCLLMMGLASSQAVAQQASPGSQAQATAVNGRNAMWVILSLDGSRTGDLRKIEGTRWVETDAAGQPVAQFQEIKRDETSVYLLDRSRGVSLQLDLRARVAKYKEAGSRRNDMFEIQSATTELAPALPAPPPPKERIVGQFKARQAPGSYVDGASEPVRVVETPAFCWNDFATRAMGTIPGRVADCPAGFANDGGTCKRAADTIPAPSRAADCPAGYTNNGTICERAGSSKANANSRAADCPAGFENSGTACFRLSAATPLGLDAMSCKAGEAKVGARCYKPCETGFVSAGASCTRPASTLGADKMTCKAGSQKNGGGQRCVADCANGYTNTGEACFRAAQTMGLEAMSCKAGETRTGGRCVAATNNCAKGEVQQGGLCYTPCAAGFDGVGTACWSQPPKSWAHCGMGSAKNSQACSALVLDQVAAVKQAAVVVGLLGSSAPGARVDLVSMQKKFKEMADTYNRAKDLPQLKKARADWEQANRGKDGYASLDSMATATTEENMVRQAAQLLAIVELSGAAATVPSYPKCSTVATLK